MQFSGMKISRIIAALAVVQTVLIILLASRIHQLETQTAELRNSLERHAFAEPRSGLDLPDRGQAGVGSRELRRIIREELAAGHTRTAPASAPVPVPAQPEIDEIEMAYRRDEVADELEYLKERGDVSTMELDRLLARIARLDPQARTEMMNELNRAMNRGEIKGHL